MQYIFILLLILFAVKAHSAPETDVLFLDVNNSPKEVEAARKAAEKSGRGFVVFPPHTDAQKKELKKAEEALKTITKTTDKKCAGSKTAEDCLKSKDALSAAYDSVQAIHKSLRVDEKDLEKFLDARGGRPISSLIVSGHDGTGTFTGKFGRLASADIARLVWKNPLNKESLRSMHLLGCYTTSPGGLILDWTKNFPSLDLITGYEDRAPLGDRPDGIRFLRGIILQEEKLMAAGDSKKLQDLLKKIPGATAMLPGVLACGQFASLTDHFELAKYGDRCQELKPDLLALGPQFECFLNARHTDCKDVPKDTDHGKLRKFYALLQKTSACSEVLKDSSFDLYDRDQAVRLLLFKKVKANFQNIYQKKLNEVDSMLEELGAPADLRFANYGKLSRAEIVARIEGLQDFVNGHNPPPNVDPDTLIVTGREAKLESMRTFLDNLIGVTMKMHDGCVPFEWTEPDQSVKAKCIKEEQIGYAGVEYELLDPADIKEDLLARTLKGIKTQREKLENTIPRSFQEDKVGRQLTLLNWRARLIDYARENPEGIDDDKLYRQKMDRLKKIVLAAERGATDPELDPEVIRVTQDLKGTFLKRKIASTAKRVREIRESLLAKADGGPLGPNQMLIEKSKELVKLELTDRALTLYGAGVRPENNPELRDTLIDLGRIEAERLTKYNSGELEGQKFKLANLGDSMHPNVVTVRNSVLAKIEAHKRELEDLKTEEKILWLGREYTLSVKDSD